MVFYRFQVYNNDSTTAHIIQDKCSLNPLYLFHPLLGLLLVPRFFLANIYIPLPWGELGWFGGSIETKKKKKIVSELVFLFGFCVFQTEFVKPKRKPQIVVHNKILHNYRGKNNGTFGSSPAGLEKEGNRVGLTLEVSGGWRVGGLGRQERAALVGPLRMYGPPWSLPVPRGLSIILQPRDSSNTLSAPGQEQMTLLLRNHRKVDSHPELRHNVYIIHLISPQHDGAPSSHIITRKWGEGGRLDILRDHIHTTFTIVYG